MSGDKFRLELSGDGSQTIYSTKFNATFHSRHGAIQESEHVFIKHGLHYKAQTLKEIAVFEVGYGSGLNAALSYLYSHENNINIHYTAIDAYPIGLELAAQLNYHLLRPELSADLFTRFHQENWDESILIGERFHLTRWNQKLELGVNGKYDLIYFDAFASNDQPELWTPGIFLNMYEILNEGGILVSYACTGKLKRLLKACKFQVSKLPGPPGKREMIRAEKAQLSVL